CPQMNRKLPEFAANVCNEWPLCTASIDATELIISYPACEPGVPFPAPTVFSRTSAYADLDDVETLSGCPARRPGRGPDRTWRLRSPPCRDRGGRGFRPRRQRRQCDQRAQGQRQYRHVQQAVSPQRVDPGERA